jgi:hypothetical protein
MCYICPSQLGIYHSMWWFPVLSIFIQNT